MRGRSHAPPVLSRLRSRPSGGALVGTVLGSAPGFVLPFLVTLRIEAGRTTDAWFFALALAIFVSSIVALALEASVMAAATFHRRQGRRHLRSFVRGVVARSAAITIAAYVAVALLGAATVLLRGNWSAADQRLCMELMAVFGALLAAIAVTSVLAGCLSAEQRFFLSRLTLALRSLVPLPVLFLAPADAGGLLLVAAAVAAGEWLRAGLLWVALRRRMAALPEQAEPPDTAAPAVWSIALPYGIAMVLFGANQVVDRIVAGSLDAGAVTTLDLAEKVFYAPITVITSSVMLVAGARWAAMTLDRREELAADFHATVRRAAVLSTVLAAVLGTGALVVLVSTDATVAGVDTVAFCSVLALLLVGLPAAVVTNAGVRLLTVLQRTRSFPRLALVSFAACVAGDVIGAALFGVQGIALAGTVWRVVNLALFLHLGSAALAALTHPPPTVALGAAPVLARPSIRPETSR